MAIKEFENQTKYQRAGKIHLGIKGEKGRPQSTDYFVCPDEVKAVYGEKPKMLEIMVFSDNKEDFMPYYYKKYGKNQLMCRGNGKDCRIFKGFDETTKLEKWIDGPCDRETCSAAQGDKPQCNMVLNLKFIIPKVNKTAFYQLDTRSVNTLKNIQGAVDMLKQVTGQIAWIPMILTVVEEKSSMGKYPILMLNEDTKAERSISQPVPELPVRDMYSELSNFWSGIMRKSNFKNTPKIKQVAVLITLANKYFATKKLGGIHSVKELSDEGVDDLLSAWKPKKDEIVQWVNNHLSAPITPKE
jgi:hypothetical protein